MVYVEYSAHGFPYVADPLPVGIDEAEKRIADWKEHADTVGGDARICNQQPPTEASDE